MVKNLKVEGVKFSDYDRPKCKKEEPIHGTIPTFAVEISPVAFKLNSCQ